MNTMTRLSSYREHCVLSAAALLLCALTEPASAETVMRITSDRTPAAPQTVSGQAAVGPLPTPPGGKTFIRIIGDRQITVPKPARKQTVGPEPHQSASAVDERGKVAEKAEQEQDRLTETKGEQEDEAALQAAIARLEAARAALIESSRLAVAAPGTQEKATRSKQAGRRQKGVKKRQRKCLKYSTR